MAVSTKNIKIEGDGESTLKNKTQKKKEEKIQTSD
jgi:hypothetical protein